MNTNKNTEVQAAITFPTEPLLAPTAYVALEESQNIKATVISNKVDVNHNGKPFLRLTMQMKNGRTTHDMYLTAGAAANTARQIKRAFNVDITTGCDTDAEGNSLNTFSVLNGQDCSLSTGIDDFNGRVKVRFVNRYNPHAGEAVDLTAIFAAAAAQPEVNIEDCEF